MTRLEAEKLAAISKKLVAALHEQIEPYTGGWATPEELKRQRTRDVRARAIIAEWRDLMREIGAA